MKEVQLGSMSTSYDLWSRALDRICEESTTITNELFLKLKEINDDLDSEVPDELLFSRQILLCIQQMIKNPRVADYEFAFPEFTSKEQFGKETHPVEELESFESATSTIITEISEALVSLKKEIEGHRSKESVKDVIQIARRIQLIKLVRV
jgi:hypothetical protein